MRSWIVANARPAASLAVLFLVIGVGLGFALAGGAAVLAPRAAQPAAPPPAVLLVEPSLTPLPPSTLVVHVSGAVRQPGVYTLQEGQRVQDAIAAAGGPTDAADPNALNLAAPLKDGQRIVVPSDIPSPRAAAAGVTPSAQGPLDLNTASAAELEALPGIGPVTAARIVRYREESGGFRSVDELRTLKLVNEATFAKLRDLVVVN